MLRTLLLNFVVVRLRIVERPEYPCGVDGVFVVDALVDDVVVCVGSTRTTAGEVERAVFRRLCDPNKKDMFAFLTLSLLVLVSTTI